jgi:type IV pilus assembly protein PilC
MPYYTCRIAGENGQINIQSRLASSPEECRKVFESEGLFVLSVRRDWKELRTQGILSGHKVKDKDFILFNQELVALIRSGFPILRSLDVIAGRIKAVYFKELLTKVAGDVKLGKALSEAFLPYERHFGKVYTASLMAGERSGNLPGALSRYIQYAKTVSQTKSRIRSALAYPTVLLVFGLIVMGILVNFILPRFADFYQSLEAQMPKISKLLMAFAMFMNHHWYFFIALMVLFVLAAVAVKNKPEFRLSWDKAKLRIPYGKGIWQESSISLFSRTLGLLLEAGITLLSAIGIAIQAMPNRHLARLMKDVPEYIKNGESLSESLAKSAAFPALALDMVRIGETSANLQGMLSDVADFYDERIRVKIDTLVSLIEPLIIIFMGLLAAAMLLSVYLPIFNVIRATRF